LLFRSPLPKGEGIKQALNWNRNSYWTCGGFGSYADNAASTQD
jgi:hypothetical protein